MPVVYLFHASELHVAQMPHPQSIMEMLWKELTGYQHTDTHATDYEYA